MKINKIYIVLFLFFAVFFVACEKNITIELPEYESELVIESYLEEGLPYIVSVTESVSFLASLELPTVPNALVTITHNGITDTLQFLDVAYFNLETIVQPNDFEPYFLRVEDLTTGRIAEASTQLLPSLPIDTISYLVNDTLGAAMLMYFYDDETIENYYKVWFAKANENILNECYNENIGLTLSCFADFDSLFVADKIVTWEFSDNIFEAGSRVPVGMGYNYKVGDVVVCRLYNISKSYYDFLETVSDASSAASNPISRPARIISNITGGLGIFTSVNYEEKIIVISG